MERERENRLNRSANTLNAIAGLSSMGQFLENSLPFVVFATEGCMLSGTAQTEKRSLKAPPFCLREREAQLPFLGRPAFFASDSTMRPSAPT